MKRFNTKNTSIVVDGQELKSKSVTASSEGGFDPDTVIEMQVAYTPSGGWGKRLLLQIESGGEVLIYHCLKQTADQKVS